MVGLSYGEGRSRQGVGFFYESFYLIVQLEAKQVILGFFYLFYLCAFNLVPIS